MSSLAMGWRLVGKIQTMYWCHRARKVLALLKIRARNLLKRDAFDPGNVFSYLDQNGKEQFPVGKTGVSVHLTACPDEMYGLAKRLSGHNGLRHKVDPQYFAWRFRSPLANYRFLLSTNDRLEGYLVLETSANRSKFWVGVVDWAAANSQVLADLLKTAIHWGQFAELRIWSSTLSEEERAVLLAIGFCDLKEPSIKESLPTILVTSTNPDTPPKDWVLDHSPLLELSNWNLRMIHSDNF